VEVTHGTAGFHPQLHIVVLFDTPMSDLMVEELGGRWFARFERALTRRGFTALEFSGGLERVPWISSAGCGRPCWCLIVTI
jgi:hypothetical protein